MQMAHYVTCQICKKRFDRDKYPAIAISARRYVHTACQEISSKEKLFNLKHMSNRINLQIKKYLQEHPEYTYSGIRRSLEYFYEIKKNPIEKANGGIGIVPWIYEEAKQYYYNQWLLSQKNAKKDISAYVPKIKNIIIKPPKRIPKKKRIFMFLDEEEVKNNGE